MVANVEQLKQEISEYYLDDFKKELGWLKSLALLPIEKKVKNLISGTTDLPKTFDAVQEFGWWKNIISFVSPKVANQIFDFMKQKRLEIEQRKTKEELELLKNQILGIRPQGDEEHADQLQHQQAEPDGQESGVDKTDASTAQAPSRSQHDELDAPQTADGSLNPIAMGAGVSTLGAGGVLVLDRLNRSREIKNMAQTIDASKMKYTIEQSISALKSQHQALAGAGRLSSKQLESMDKHIAKLSEGLESMDDDGIALIKLWKTLDGKLPRSLLQSTALDPSTLAKIEKLAPEFFGKTSDEIATFLTSKGIAQLPDELLKSLMQAESVAELQGMTKVLRHGSKANRILQTLAGAMLIDVACLGLDVWMYLETKKEAALIAKVNEVRAKNKTNQAYTQLAIGLASVAVEAAIIAYAVSAGTAVGGPFGTVVGLAVGGISAAASMGVDSLYFDVHDFYTQNQEDFLRQSRGKLKHAILQGIHNQQEGNVSLNEKVQHSIAHLFSIEGKDAKEQSLRDACFSMLFLEEVGIGEFKDDSDLLAYLHSGQKKADFLSALPPESAKSFIDKWEAITARINLRLEYIETQLQKPEMIDSIKRHQGMQSLTQLFTLSTLYAYQGKQGWKADLSSEDKLAITKSAFFADFPAEKLKKFEQLGVENPALFQEIVKTASLDALLRADEEDDRYTQNVQLVLKYQEWLALRQSYEEAVYLEIPDVHKNVNFVEQLLYADFDLQQVTYPSFDTDGAIDLVQQGLERRGMMEIADDPMQNVLYQLAKQLYGYAGQNDQEALMQFFSENGETYGLYYDKQRKVNEDWAVDEGIGTLDLGEYSEEEVPQIVDAFVEQQTDARFSFGFSWRKMIATSNPALMLMHLFSHEEKSIIDTPTESIDPALQAEWKQQLRILLIQELQLRTQENKTKVKNQISNFVQTHAQDGRYLELPYYLLIEARKAGFGDLQRQFFAWKDGRLQMLSLQSELTIGSGLAEERAYFTQAREIFTAQEQRYIDRVEQAHQRLESLRSIEGN
ncbi:MAG: hypothetical protein Q4B28_02655 [bacterium]|nr:hypothetical protein [bacterium]